MFRVLPHQQNTGGFFVALLQKKALCPWEKQNKGEGKENREQAENGKGEEKNGEEKIGEEAMVGERKAKEPPRKKHKFQGFREDPYLYLKVSTFGSRVANFSKFHLA